MKLFLIETESSVLNQMYFELKVFWFNLNDNLV